MNPTGIALVNVPRAEDVKKAVNAVRPFQGAVLIAGGEKPVVQHVEGFADREKKIPLTVESRFVVGSIAKQITAVLILRLVEKGKVDLDAPVGKYLDLKADWAGQVTVRHLLNHTSGIVAEDQPLKAEPGKTFAYSNLGFDLLGRIVERVSKKPFSASVLELFRVSGMKQSSVLEPVANPGLATGYDEVSLLNFSVASMAAQSKHPASGGMVSTVNDLVRWNAALHGGKLLSKSGYQAMVTPGIRRTNRWGDIGYGFGLQITTNGGRLEYSHGGYVAGFQSTLLYYPETRRTVVILENVSWNLDDTTRAFAPHDAVRDLVK